MISCAFPVSSCSMTAWKVLRDMNPFLHGLDHMEKWHLSLPQARTLLVPMTCNISHGKVEMLEVPKTRFRV